MPLEMNVIEKELYKPHYFKHSQLHHYKHCYHTAAHVPRMKAGSLLSGVSSQSLP